MIILRRNVRNKLPHLRRVSSRSGSLRLSLNACLVTGLFTLLSCTTAWGAPVIIPTPQPAMNGLSCVGTRNQGDMNCTAKEFTVGSSFSAAPGTPPFCIAGQSFEFQVELSLSESNADRYNMAFYTGETGNNPQLYDASKLCSVATFPTAPAPFQNYDGDACGDYQAAGDSVITLNRIKSLCQGDSTGALQIPYTLTYFQNTSTTCSGPLDVQVPPSSKCQANTALVNGAVAVFSGAYVDVTKQTAPDGDGQPFSFTATGPAGSKVIALTGAILTPATATGGSYSPASIAAATNSSTVTLHDNETVRFYITALDTDQVLTITEAATSNWESGAALSCSAVTGVPTLITNNASRSITAILNSVNSAAACSITNTKRSRITLRKQVAGRIAATDQFRVSASGGGTLTGTTSATTSGAGALASTTFYSTPGAALNLTDAKSGGPTPLARYAASLSCSNAFTGAGATDATSLPGNLITSAYSFTPAPGDDITCTFTNTPRASLSKAYSAGTIGMGASSTLTFTINNGVGNPEQSGLAFTDSFPAGLTVTAVGALSGAGCSGTPSFTASSVSLAAGAISAGNGVCGFSATVRGNTAGSYLNDSTRFSAQGGGLDTAAASATLNVYGLPLISILKSADRGSADPGEVVVYTVQIVNTGSGAGTEVVLTDDLSPYGAFYLGAGTPFSFTDSVPASGLALGTPQYSNDDGSSWLYAPVSGGGGAPAGYDGTVTDWRVPMNGSIRAGGSFLLRYRVVVQ